MNFAGKKTLIGLLILGLFYPVAGTAQESDVPFTCSTTIPPESLPVVAAPVRDTVRAVVIYACGTYAQDSLLPA